MVTRPSHTAGTPSAAGPRFEILGPLQTVVAGRPVELGGHKQRALLAMLLIHVNRFVPASRLIDALWDEAPPASADVTLRTHVSHLRRFLTTAGADGALVTRPTGYCLVLDSEQIDAGRFERLAGLGQEALGLGDPARAARLLREALALWRGPALEDFRDPMFARSEAIRLDALRLAAVEDRVDADLRLGRHREVVDELERLVHAHPFRERLSGQLMLALYGSGRQVDALAVYSATKQRLADELGLDPSRSLSALETAILRHDPALLPPELAPLPRTIETSTVRPPPDALFAAARRAPMVGRSTELERLRGWWQAVRDGGRQVVLVSGEAGVGKTRLVAELANLAGEEGDTFLVGRADPVAATPYHPISTALRGAATVDPVLADASEILRTRLAPLLAPARIESDAASPTADDDAPDQRHSLFEAVEWLLARIATATPVALVLEESERIDRASSLLLRHLIGHLPRRVLVIVCFRDPPGTRHLPLQELVGELEDRGMAARLTVRPLAESDVDDLVTELAGTRPSPQHVRQVWQRTAGNPFYVTELVRDVLDGHWVEQVPAGVRDLLRHRLRPLPEPTRQVVRAAAVLGRDVEFGLLAQLVDQQEDLVIEALQRAIDAGLLIESGRSWKSGYAFPHELTRDAVYTDLPAQERQRLHLRAARALLSCDPTGGARLTTAAVHLREAGPAADPLQAAELSLRAATEASAVYAWDEAVTHAEAAVDILDQVGAPPESRGAAAVRAADLRLRSSTGYARAVRHLEAALEHHRGLGDEAATAAIHSRLGLALCTHHSVMDIPRAMEHFAVAERLVAVPTAQCHLYLGKTQAAMFGLRTDVLGTTAQRAYELAIGLGRRDLGLLAGWGRAWFGFNRGRLSAAAELLEEMWAGAQELADPYVGWASVNAGALCATEYLLDPAAGRAWSRRGLGQTRLDAFSHAHTAVIDQFVLSLATMGELANARAAAEPLPADAVGRRLLGFLDGGWEAAEAAWAAALAADEAAGDHHDAAFNARWLARARAMLGKDAEAVATFRHALDLVDGTQVPTELRLRAELAQLLAAAGDHAGSEPQLARCDEILESGEDWRGLVGVVELARGTAAADHLSRSDAAYSKALEVFATYRLPWHRADALDVWARAQLSAGRVDAAIATHRAAWAVYDEIGAASRWRRPLPSA